MEAVTLTSTGTQNALDVVASLLPSGSANPIVGMGWGHSAGGILVRCNNASALTINGMLAPQDYTGSNGQVGVYYGWPTYFFTLLNANVTFAHNSGTPSAHRKLWTQGANLTLSANSSVAITYDGISEFWRVIARATSG